MQYFAYPEYTSGPKSPVATGSMVANEELILVCLHAVAREDDGIMPKQTVCGRPAHFNPKRRIRTLGSWSTSIASAESARTSLVTCTSADSWASR
jgi:hypothetical protein